MTYAGSSKDWSFNRTTPQLKRAAEEYMQAIGRTATKAFPVKQGDTLTF